MARAAVRPNQNAVHVFLRRRRRLLAWPASARAASASERPSPASEPTCNKLRRLNAFAIAQHLGKEIQHGQSSLRQAGTAGRTDAARQDGRRSGTARARSRPASSQSPDSKAVVGGQQDKWGGGYLIIGLRRGATSLHLRQVDPRRHARRLRRVCRLSCRERPPWRSVARRSSRNATEGVPYAACILKTPRRGRTLLATPARPTIIQARPTIALRPRSVAARLSPPAASVRSRLARRSRLGVGAMHVLRRRLSFWVALFAVCALRCCRADADAASGKIAAANVGEFAVTRRVGVACTATLLARSCWSRKLDAATASATIAATI